MNPIETYILEQEEPYQSIMIYLRFTVKKILPEIEEAYNYRIPFFKFNNKPLCYMNILKGTDFVDFAFVRGVNLVHNFPELQNFKERKQVRSLQIKDLEDFDEKRFGELLIAAKEELATARKAWFI
jgi:hypothetical protein